MSYDHFEPSAPAAVSRHADGDRWQLVFVRELPHAPEAVWAALTDPQRLSQWSPYTADRDLGTPGPVVLTMIDSDTPRDLAATVTEAAAPEVLEHTWGDDVIRWQLEPIDSGTRLTLLQTFDDPESAPRAAAGWHLCLDVAGRLLSGDPVGPIVGEAALDHGWEDLRTEYERLLAGHVG